MAVLNQLRSSVNTTARDLHRALILVQRNEGAAAVTLIAAIKAEVDNIQTYIVADDFTSDYTPVS